MTELNNPPARVKRKEIIVKAAADELSENGLSSFTHRTIAERAQVPLGSITYYFSSISDLQKDALELLSQEIDGDLNVIKYSLQNGAASADLVAEMIHSYLISIKDSRASIAIYEAAFRNEDMRYLAERWFIGFQDILRDYIDPDNADSISVFCDGAIMAAAIYGKTSTLTSLKKAIGALWGA